MVFVFGTRVIWYTALSSKTNCTCHLLICADCSTLHTSTFLTRSWQVRCSDYNMAVVLLLDTFVLPPLPPPLSPTTSPSYVFHPLFFSSLPSSFLWLFIFPCLSFSPFPPTSSPHSTLSSHPALLFSSSTDFTSPEVHLPMAEEKDYFTVTDELSRENSHFALSEALLVVIEQVG